MSDPVFSDADFDRVRELVYAKTGMRFEVGRRPYVEKRVLERVAKTREGSTAQYLSRVRFEVGGMELQELINTLTVNETYFYREDYQLKCMTNALIPELVQNGRKSLRIWSLPCSTGEEAYTIALYLLEHLQGVDDLEIEIIGSDIDTEVLRAAERATYQTRSVQYVPAALLQKYFERVEGDKWRICAGLRDSVSFGRVSVVDRLQMLQKGRFDIVFCRNLLIYFDEQSRRQAADNIFEALTPGGFICLGHSESMSRISASFRIRKFDDAVVYQRPRSP